MEHICLNMHYFTLQTKQQTMKILSTIILALTVTAVSAQTSWTIDKSHSKIGFNVTHMVVSEVEGEFKEYEATVTSTTDDFNGAAVEFTAQVASIDTDSEKRDGHLKSDEFFNAEKFPTITFKGKLVKEGDKYFLKGNFTMRDVTKVVSFPVKFNGTVDTGRGMKAGFKVEGKVKRFEYGLKWDSALANGSYVVGDEVEIICKLELNKAK